MTEERLQFFLHTDTIDDDEFAFLVNWYFILDKKDWYDEKDGRKTWDQSKVNSFWKLLRKHVMTRFKVSKRYDFSYYIFPEFSLLIDETQVHGDYLFWSDGDKRVFDKEVEFYRTTFLGNTRFHGIHFLATASFSHAVFMDYAGFRGVTFSDDAFFVETAFCKKADFGSSIFSGKAIFRSISFNTNANFSTIEMRKSAEFSGVMFSGKTSFNSAKFEEVLFQDLVSHIDFEELDFSGVNFPNVSTFRRVYMDKIIFTQTDLLPIQFKGCIWEGRLRIILKEEKLTLGSASQYYSLEDQYRLLKKNFDSNKDWELSGKAYVSEMEMRKKRLWRQKDYYHWIIYWFYGFFGGYTQDLKRPIISLVGLIIASSFIYYPIDCNPLWAIQRGFYGALPKIVMIDILEESRFNGYWLIASNIETILGSTFLVFFILALRKRFKQ